MLPNGAYFWRVRSLDAANDSSKWSGVRKFTKKWNAMATLLTPGEPEHDRLSESRDSDAGRPCRAPSTYHVSVATGASGGGVDAPGGIISKGALAWNDGGKPITTSNTNLAVSTSLHPGTYYWQVVPVDAEGNAGTPSAIFSFAWIWAGTTTPTVTDMVPGVEIYDPLFQWARDSGRRQLRDRGQHDLGLRDRLASCSQRDDRATSFAPTATLPNNTYYWRVRGVDPQGQAGPWNNGPTFDKTYDQTVASRAAESDRLRTRSSQPIAPGGNVNEPVVTWSTVPGARHYEVQIDVQRHDHDLQHGEHRLDAVRQHRQLGAPAVLQRARTSASSRERRVADRRHVHVFVRAFTDNAIDGTPIAGPYAIDQLRRRRRAGFNNPPTIDCHVVGSRATGASTPAPTSSRPASAASSARARCSAGSRPTWTPRASVTTRQHGYWVTIARDSNFTTVVQAAYTDEPCYAPRSPLVDEGTLYYWQVIPTRQRRLRLHGRRRACWAASTSLAELPARVGAADADPARRRRVRLRDRRVPVDPGAGAGQELHDRGRRRTPRSARTSSRPRPTPRPTRRPTIYPVGTTLYWRVRANNDDSQGLAWSGTSTFVQTLPVPTITTAAPFLGRHVPGAHVDAGRRRHGLRGAERVARRRARTTTTVPSAAVSYTKMTGTGHGTRAGARGLRQRRKSAYTPTRDVVHTIAEPGGTKTQLINKPGKLALTFAWNTKTNAKQYKVQVSRTPGFAQPFLDEHDRPVVVHAAAHPAGLHRRRRHVLARRRGRPGRQRRRVQQGQEVHAPGAHAGADRRPAAARAARRR